MKECFFNLKLGRQLTMSAGGIGLRRRRDRVKSTKIAGLFIPQDLFKHMLLFQ